MIFVNEFVPRFKEYYKRHYDAHCVDDLPLETGRARQGLEHPLVEDHRSRLWKNRKIATALSSGGSELLRYTQTSVAATEVDILAWWVTNERVFPNLSKMALDILSIPSTSAPSERLFSDAGQVVTERRNRLGPGTLRACVCLDAWWQVME